MLVTLLVLLFPTVVADVFQTVKKGRGLEANATAADCCRNWSPECYTTAGPHNKYHSCSACGPRPCSAVCSNWAGGDPSSRACQICCQHYPSHEVDWQCSADGAIAPATGSWLDKSQACHAGENPSAWYCLQQAFYDTHLMNETECLDLCRSFGLPGCCHIYIRENAPYYGRGECDFRWDGSPQVDFVEADPKRYSAVMSAGAGEGLGCYENMPGATTPGPTTISPTTTEAQQTTTEAQQRTSTTQTTTEFMRESVTTIIATKYLGKDDTNWCPWYSSVSGGLSECECRLYAQDVSREFRLLQDASMTKGCSQSDRLVYYNAHSVGRGQMGKSPVCKSSKEVTYVVGDDETNSCPDGTRPLNLDECLEMPLVFGGTFHDEMPINEAWDPNGCFRYGAHAFYFNDHPGRSRNNRRPICKEVNIL